MKKLFSLLAAIILIVAFSVSVAEEEPVTVIFDEALSLTLVIPEGYSTQQYNENGMILLHMIPDDQNAVNMVILISATESFDAVRLNDMDPDELQAFADSMREDYADPTVEILETGMGTKLVLVNENGSDMDFACMAALYHGYEISTLIQYQDGKQITEEDIALALKVNTDLNFVFAK